MLQAYSGDYGRVLMFEDVHSVGISEVDSLSLVDVVLLLKLRIGHMVLDAGVETLRGPYYKRVQLPHIPEYLP